MKEWQRIRAVRSDLTDHVIHFTRHAWTGGPSPQMVIARDVLLQIIRVGQIWPTFAAMRNRSSTTRRATVKGPDPAVCLTEQPLWAVAQTHGTTRYSGYGVAYPKYLLHAHGGRPVMYATDDVLGERILPGDSEYQPEKDIWRGGLPAELQYLWVNYKPTISIIGEYPVDFTWEREWRIKPRFWGMTGLPVAFVNNWGVAECAGAIVVERDQDLSLFQAEVMNHRTAGVVWAKHIGKVVSLETVQRRYATDGRYARIETYPEGLIGP